MTAEAAGSQGEITVSYFEVHLDEMQHLRAQLQNCVDRMRAAQSRLEAARAGQLGTGDLDRAWAHYADRWDYGIGQMAEGTSRIGQGVQQAQQAYAGTEEMICRAYADAARGPGGSGGAA